MAVFKAYTIEQAAKVANVSPRRVRYWAERGVLVPSIVYENKVDSRRALYSFRDLVGLRTLGTLRDRYGISLQSLRRAGHYLREHSEAPWSELRLWVQGKDVLFVSPPAESVVSATRPGQHVIEIDLEPVFRDAEQASEALRRSTSDIGQTERRRGVQGNELIFKGTRVPVASVLDLATAGYDTDAILRAFPSLDRVDVQAATASHYASHVA